MKKTKKKLKLNKLKNMIGAIPRIIKIKLVFKSENLFNNKW